MRATSLVAAALLIATAACSEHVPGNPFDGGAGGAGGKDAGSQDVGDDGNADSPAEAIGDAKDAPKDAPKDSVPPVDVDPDAPSPDGSGLMCKSDTDCGPDEFCSVGCSVMDVAICDAVPKDCPKLKDPVCGCDKMTYISDCFRRMARVGLLFKGDCSGPPPPPPLDGGPSPDGGPGVMCSEPMMPCPDGRLCDAPGCAAGTGGVCLGAPEPCTDVYKPVCGCDGMTYGNDCKRQGAGVRKNHDGAC